MFAIFIKVNSQSDAMSNIACQPCPFVKTAFFTLLIYLLGFSIFVIFGIQQTFWGRKNKFNEITKQDIFISVKTTNQFHSSRLQVIIDTWFQFAKKETYFYTDLEDAIYQRKTGKLLTKNTA